MIVHNLDPILIDLGFFAVRWYSLSYIAGIALGLFYAIKIIKNKNQLTSIEQSSFEELFIYLIFGIIFGGRLGYVFFYDFEYYSNNIIEIFKIWNGGMSFHGGLLGIIISTLIFSKVTKNSFFSFTDIIACVAPIGIFLGRIANFINSELVGKVSSLPWAVIYPLVDNKPRHPSQIYEAILEGLILFVLINFLAIKKKLLIQRGYISGLFLIFYSILRIFAEIFREPDKHIGYIYNFISMGSFLSIISLICGLVIIFFVKKNVQNN